MNLANFRGVYTDLEIDCANGPKPTLHQCNYANDNWNIYD